VVDALFARRALGFFDLDPCFGLKYAPSKAAKRGIHFSLAVNGMG